MNPSALLGRLIRARAVAAAALAGLTAILAATFAALLVTAATAETALAQSVRAHYAGHEYLMDAADDNINQILAARTDTHPVRDEIGAADTPNRSVPLTIRYATPRAVPGTIIEGRPPISADEVALSDAAMRALQTTVGGRIKLVAAGKQRPTVIVGRLIDTADHDAAAAVTIGDFTTDQTPTWITSTDPLTDPALQQAFNDRAIAYRSVTTLVANQRATPALALATSLRIGAAIVAATTPILLAPILQLLRRSNTTTIDALAAAGVPHRRGWTVLAGAGAICALGGAAIGAAAATVTAGALRQPLSAALGQWWTHLTVPWTPLAAYVLLAPAASLGGAALLSAAGRMHFPRLRFPPVLGFAAPTALAIAVAIWFLIWRHHLSPAVTAVAAILFVIAGIALLRPLSTVRAPAPLATVISTLGQALTAFGIVIGAVILATGTYAANQINRSALSESMHIPLQPAGSYLVLGTTTDQSDRLSHLYTTLGGRDVRRYLEPDEPHHTVRVTSPGVIRCLAQNENQDIGEALDTCGPRDTASPLNAVLLDRTSSGSPIEADPTLVENGQIGLLDFDVPSSRIVTRELAAAAASASLGGNMPGAVIPVGSELAQRLDLRPSGFELIALVDFAALDTSDQAQIRSLAIRLAPTAQISEGHGFDDSTRQSVARLVAYGGAVLAALLALVAAFNVIAAHRDYRRTLTDLGAGTRFRYIQAARLFLPALAAPAIAGIGVAINAWFLAGPEATTHTVIWLIPVIAATATMGAALIPYARPPAAQK